MNDLISDFVKISKFAGMREDLVQAGGGNSSCKISKSKMLIKASGYQLSEVSENSGYSEVNPELINNFFAENRDLNTITVEIGNDLIKRAFIFGEKPSIETFLHSLAGRFTLHLHSIVVNALTCRMSWKEELESIFPDAILVPYATPGVQLAKQYYISLAEHKSKGTDKIIFMQNHGLVVSGNDADEVINKVEYVTDTIEKYLKIEDFKPYHNLTRLWRCMQNKIIWKVTDANVLNFYNKYGLWEHTFLPDCVLFLGKKMLSIKYNVEEEINSFIKYNADPVIIEYEHALYICADCIKKVFEIQSILSSSALIADINFGRENIYLSEKEKNNLLNWEDEKYRRNK